MPWCDACDKYLAPNALDLDGTCPTCHAVADVGDTKVEIKDGKAPWHFWVMVVALVLYLGWRLIEAVLWVAT